MRVVPAIPGMLVIMLAAGTVLAGCTTEHAADVRPGYSGAVSPAMRAHQRRQAIRAEEGGYRRLYRPRDCRYGARNCGGYATFDPS
ncbi:MULTISPECIES: hypothetical protein [unclassified Shinella]|uniref:hypothetical protein n=1 Tax=unclassified Shinella TaxID=2643062 RepID=UPI00225DBA0A|nr:hypothetical protein [Shinella sp. YE25]MDC7259153.1 hypothetical protein [Shinella sp. YE25]CAI0335934.1 conserved exported hypothetical protein [Rhizobiaceae bacterium]CAK7261329.1 Lipoprotein [Shinella sp. WSC3-e]